ncbi:MFS transporter [Acidiplasma aeolicum]|nr:MFS transporter [Acidiplasma aeolicum]
MQEKRSPEYLIGMNSIHIGTNFLWISFESYILPIELINFVNNSLFLGFIAFIGTAAGVFIGLISGTASDKYTFLWGRRGPYIIIGVILTVFSIFLDEVMKINVFGILIGYIMIQISSNISVGAYQPLFVDFLHKDERGAAAGINGLFILIGSAMGYAVTGYFITVGKTIYGLIVISAVLIFTGILTTGTIKKDDSVIVHSRERLFKIFMDIFNLKKGIKSYIYVVLGSFMVFSGVVGLSFFELYFFKYILNYSNPAYYVSIAGIVVLVVSALASVVFGIFSDRVGRVKMLLFTTLIGSLAMFLIPEFEKFTYFLIFGSMIGISYGIFMSVSKALASDMSPREEAGKFMAYYNIATGGASSISPLIYGLILFFVKSYSLGFKLVFYTAGIFFIMGFLLFLYVKISDQ